MKTKTYQDFDLSIEKAGERYRARVLSSPDGPAPPTEFDLPFSDMQLENFILRFGQTRRTMRNIGVAGETVNRSLRDFGGRLYSAIFSGSVADRLHGSLGIVGQQENAGLRIRLRLSDAPELIDVPWEYLFDASAGRFLTLSVDTPVVRYLDMPGQVKPLAVQPPLRILVMLSSPAGYAELNVEQEWQKLKDAVADLERRGLVILERMEKPTLAELQRRLRKQDIHIFHFIGHGGFDEAAQDGVLILETEDGKARPTSGKNLGTILHDEKSVQLAVLNACEGGRTSRHDPFAGVGQSLVQSGIPAVVAMQFEISDQAAITLAHEFYAALADNYPVDAALAEARKAIFAQDNIIEWGTPVLYMRAQDGQIFDVTAPAVQPTSPSAQVVDKSAPSPTLSSPVVPTGRPSEASEVIGPGFEREMKGSDGASPAIQGLGPQTTQSKSGTLIGLHIATWSAVVAIIAFFLPVSGPYSGLNLLTSGNSSLLLLLLSYVGILSIRVLRHYGKNVQTTVPIIAIGAMGVILNFGPGIAPRGGIGSGIFLLSSLAILVGGLADLMLVENRRMARSSYLQIGHLLAISGGMVALIGVFVIGRAVFAISPSWIYPSMVLAPFLIIQILALLALRRGRPTIWDGFADMILALFLAGTGYMMASEGSAGTSAGIVALLSGVIVLTGGIVNLADGLKARRNP